MSGQQKHKGAGHIALGEKMMDLSTDYTVAYAILGVQRLVSSGVAVAIVTAASVVATINGAQLCQVTASDVLTSNGAPPTDKADAKYAATLAPLYSVFGCRSHRSARLLRQRRLLREHTERRDPL